MKGETLVVPPEKMQTTSCDKFLGGPLNAHLRSAGEAAVRQVYGTRLLVAKKQGLMPNPRRVGLPAGHPGGQLTGWHGPCNAVALCHGLHTFDDHFTPMALLSQRAPPLPRNCSR